MEKRRFNTALTDRPKTSNKETQTSNKEQGDASKDQIKEEYERRTKEQQGGKTGKDKGHQDAVDSAQQIVFKVE